MDAAAGLGSLRVAIVGVGGTGSHVLDFVSKTPVKSIDVFDDDLFLRKNALRSPGPVADMRSPPRKAIYHAERYGEHVRAIPERIGPENVECLGRYDTVFLCIDGGSIKRLVLDVCVANDVTLIDVGMGIYMEGSSLTGSLRVTTATAEKHGHMEYLVGLDGPPETSDALRDNNNQSVELNALNAALAVIKWKKVVGIFRDGGEIHCVYDLERNRLYNRDSATPGHRHTTPPRSR